MKRTTGPRFFPWKIFYRILWMQSVLVLVALAASGIAARYFFQRQFLFQVESRVREALLLLSRNLPEDVHPEWCAEQAQGTAFRFSLDGKKGTTTYCDSGTGRGEAPFAPEVFAEIEKELLADDGHSAFRARVQGHVIYAALFVGKRGLILRGAAPLTQLSETLSVFDASFGVFLVLTVIALGVLAVWSAQQLVFPLGRLLVKTKAVLAQQPEPTGKEDLDRETFDEWLELESTIDDIRRDLVAKAQSLSMEQGELETIMGSISDAILAVDPEGSPLFFNSRFELLFGGESLRKRQLKLWGIFRDPEILDAFTVALKEGKTGETKAIPLDQPGGRRRYFALSVSPLRRPKGAIYGAVGVFHDVTELKSAEQMRIDFVANVSHELRTPLTVIKGYADTLIADHQKGGGPVLDYSTSIARNSDRLMNLMNDLLDLSSIESTDILQKDPISTEEITERIVSQLKGAFDAKNQRVEVNVEVPTVIADPQRMEQVIVNLLGNANKYTPPEGLVVIRWEKDGDDVLLKVVDTGPGIPDEHQSRLFERFYRIDKARSREQGGTGLGLAIVKHIMQRHGGVVWVESRPPKGSTFVCRFPGK